MMDKHELRQALQGLKVEIRETRLRLVDVKAMGHIGAVGEAAKLLGRREERMVAAARAQAVLESPAPSQRELARGMREVRRALALG